MNDSIGQQTNGGELPAEAIPQSVQIGRGPFEYVSVGEGPAVVSLHGAMGGWDQSYLLARTIGEAGYRHIALSRPGYLGTPMSVGASPEDQADAYAAVLDKLGIDRAGVMAVSGGGPSAIHFALRHPARCAALVLVSTVGTRSSAKIPWTFHVTKNLARIRPIAEWLGRKAAANLPAAAARSIRDPALCARTLADPVNGPLFRALLGSTGDRMWQRIDGTDNDIRVSQTCEYPLESIRVPTLVVHGTGDNVAPFDPHGLALARRIPGAESLFIEGGEHVTIFTHRAEVRPRVGAFLGRYLRAD